MNVLFISPGFPPQFHQFCSALRAQGINVLGLGDTPPHELDPALHSSLGEYYFAPRLDSYEEAYRAVAYLSWKHGRIERVDSHNEHWLGLEARLREDFNIPGPRPSTLEIWRTKTGMAKVFKEAGIPRPDGVRFESKAQVQAFVKEQGYPVIFKPDTGVGAARTFKVNDERELVKVLEEPLAGYVVQPFVTGNIVSYDGLVDRTGRIVFDTSHAYSSGIMEVVLGGLDVSYWSRREIPKQLLDYGRRAVKAFGITERFFHCEFFELKDGTHKALEINVRPPGGFTTDMMNYTADLNVYELWAKAIAGQDLSGFTFERKWHVAHISRRSGVTYQRTREEALAHLGSRLLWHRWMPPVLAGAMGDEVFMVRHPELSQIKEDIAFVQAR